MQHDPHHPGYNETVATLVLADFNQSELLVGLKLDQLAAEEKIFLTNLANINSFQMKKLSTFELSSAG